MSQKTAILEALQAGDRLTPLVALERFGCLSLSQRIGQLKREGQNIASKLVETTTGKHVAEYWLQTEQSCTPS